MKTVIIFLSILLITWPNKANACDAEFVGGGVIALTTTILVPLVGLGLDDRENSPYRRALGSTFVASFAEQRSTFTVVKVIMQRERVTTQYPKPKVLGFQSYSEQLPHTLLSVLHPVELIRLQARYGNMPPKFRSHPFLAVALLGLIGLSDLFILP